MSVMEWQLASLPDSSLCDLAPLGDQKELYSAKHAAIDPRDIMLHVAEHNAAMDLIMGSCTGVDLFARVCCFSEELPLSLILRT